MGVPRLTTFIKNSESSSSTSIFQKIPSKNVKFLIIDFYPFIIQLLFIEFGVTNIYDNDYPEIKKILENFFEILKKLEILVVFVVDGLREDQKFNVSKSRYEEKYLEMLDHHNDQENSKNTKRSFSYYSNLNAFPIIKEMLLKNFAKNCEIWTGITDADPLVVSIGKKYAAKTTDNCSEGAGRVILLSNDSDFYIFEYPDNIHYCCMFDFVIDFKSQFEEPNKNFEFKVFNQKQFLSQTGLSKEKLIYIPYFFGNDYIDQNSQNYQILSRKLKNDSKVWSFLKNNNCKTRINSEILENTEKDNKFG